MRSATRTGEARGEHDDDELQQHEVQHQLVLVDCDAAAGAAAAGVRLPSS